MDVTDWQALASTLNQGVTALATGIGNKKEQKRQYKYNMQMAQWQNDVNVANWRMQNEYNLPVNQMQRLKDAGINPNIAYSSSNSATAGSVSPSSKPDAVTPINYGYLQQTMTPILDNALRAAQIGKVEQETSNLAQYQRNQMLDADYKELQIIAQRYANAKTDIERSVWREYWDNKLLGMRANNELTDATRFNLDSQRKYRDGVETDLARSTINRNEASTASTIAEMGLIEYRKGLYQAQIQQTLESALLTQYERLNISPAKLANISAQLAGIKADSNDKVINQEIDYILLQHGINLREGGKIGLLQKIKKNHSVWAGDYRPYHDF